MMRVLAGYYRSSAAYSFVHLRKGEQRGEAPLSLNPAGLVPVWSETGMTLTQSLAIIAYLDEVYSNPPLLPTDIQLRAYVRETALMVACDIHPIGNLRVLDNLAHDYKAGAEELRTGI